jgi:hypothetical protein
MGLSIKSEEAEELAPRRRRVAAVIAEYSLRHDAGRYIDPALR